MLNSGFDFVSVGNSTPNRVVTWFDFASVEDKEYGIRDKEVEFVPTFYNFNSFNNFNRP